MTLSETIHQKEDTITIFNQDDMPLSHSMCRQILKPIPQSFLRRTVNGQLINCGRVTMQKYRSIIICEDQLPPPFDACWVGSLVKIQCIQAIAQPIKALTKKATLARKPIGGKVDFLGAEGPCNIPYEIEGENLLFSQSLPVDCWLVYRPLLITRVIDFTWETEEWETKNSWHLVADEV